MIDIRVGDCRDLLAAMPAESVQCVMTSPPYVGQRDYGVAGQIGQEPTIAAFTEVMVNVFREVRRVLRKDGVLWLNLGHKFNYSGGAGGDYNDGGLRDGQAKYGGFHDPAFKPKDCLPLVWWVGPALMADGWWHRSPNVWSKPNPMPSSQTDRPTLAHEDMLLFTKSARYFYDADAVREDWAQTSIDRRHRARETPYAPPGQTENTGLEREYKGTGRNLRSVWTIPTSPFPDAHFATFPPALVEPCIKAGTSERGACPECGAPWERLVEKERTFESGSGRSGNMPIGKNGADLQGGGETGDIRRGPVVHVTTTGWQPTCDHDAEPVPQTVLDPFSGAGTTGLVAARLGRDYIGLELNPGYAEMARRRIAADTGAHTPEEAPADMATQSTYL